MSNDWRGINEFVQVVDSGSFTRAAQALHLSKSYISRTVSDLEDRLGVQLLFRNTRRLALTAAGEKFYQRCVEMRGIFSEAERELGELQAQPKGRLRVGLCAVYGVANMSAMVAEFAARNEGVSTEVVVYLDEDDLRYEDFDVLVRYGHLPDSELKIRKVGLLSYCLCAAPRYLAQNPWPSDTEGLKKHQCLSVPSGHFEFHASTGGTQKLRVQGPWVSNSAVSLAAGARHGLGIAQVPLSIVFEDVTAGRLAVLDEDWAYLDKEVWACFPPGRATAASRAFIDFITTRFSNRRLRPSMQEAMQLLRS